MLCLSISFQTQTCTLTHWNNLQLLINQIPISQTNDFLDFIASTQALFFIKRNKTMKVVTLIQKIMYNWSCNVNYLVQLKVIITLEDFFLNWKSLPFLMTLVKKIYEKVTKTHDNFIFFKFNQEVVVIYNKLEFKIHQDFSFFWTVSFNFNYPIFVNNGINTRFMLKNEIDNINSYCHICA